VRPAGVYLPQSFVHLGSNPLQVGLHYRQVSAELSEAVASATEA